MSEKLSETKMSSLAEAQWLIREIGGGGAFKVAFPHISNRLRTWTRNRIRDVYNADKRITVSADELKELQAAARTKKLRKQRVTPAFWSFVFSSPPWPKKWRKSALGWRLRKRTERASRHLRKGWRETHGANALETLIVKEIDDAQSS